MRSYGLPSNTSLTHGLNLLPPHDTAGAVAGLTGHGGGHCEHTNTVRGGCLVESGRMKTTIADAAIGRAPESLTLAERFELAGCTIALEIYSPKTLPFRRIEAVGESVEQCVAALRRRGLNPAHFEFSLLEPPY